MTTTSKRRRRHTYDRSPMRRVGSYTSPERFRYEDHNSIARRASSEILYGNSSNYLHSSYDYPSRRWSDDYSYNGRSNSFTHFDRIHHYSNYSKPSNRRYGGGSLSPRSYYDTGSSSKNYSTNLYNQKPLHSSNRSRDYTYGCDRYGDRNDDRNNLDYYDNRYNKYDKNNRTDYQDYYHQNRIPKKIAHPNERRYLLVKDLKDKRISGNGLGMKVVGGKEIPGTSGRLGAYIAKINQGGVVATLGELKEGNLVIEWNGRNLLDKTYEEVQKIISQTSEEMEIELAVRGDVDMLNDKTWTSNPLHFENKYYSSTGDRSHSQGYDTSKGNRDYSSIDPYSSRDYSSITNDQYSRGNYSSKKDARSNRDFSGRNDGYSSRDYNSKNDPYSSNRDYGDSHYAGKNDHYATRNCSSRNDPYNNRDFINRKDTYNKDYGSKYYSSHNMRDVTSKSDSYINRDYGYKNDQFSRDYNHKNDMHYNRDYRTDSSKRDPNYKDDYNSKEQNSKRPPFDLLDINGNEMGRWKNPPSNRLEDDYRNRDSYRSKGYHPKGSNTYPDNSKENYPVKDKIFDREYYSSQRSRSPSNKKPIPTKDEEYHSDRSERRHRRRRSLDSRDSKYYATRDRDMSPEYGRYDNHHRESRSYTPERHTRSHRDRSLEGDRYDRDRYNDPYSHTNQSKQSFQNAASSSNLTNPDNYHRKANNPPSGNHRSYQDYPDDRNYSQSSKHGARNQSGSQRSSRDHKRHSRSNGKSKSRGKLSHGSKQEQSTTSLGQVELQCCYDSIANILYVTVIKAKGLLTLREDGDTCPDPFVKVYLLPGRSIENQRRTRHFIRTSDPVWNQTMVYPNLQISDLKKRYLEVTAWNFDNHKPNEFLGEVVLDLSDPMVVNEEPKWYQLQEMVEPDGQQG